MEAKLFFVVLILCGLSYATPHTVLEKLLEKRVATVNYNAYSNDINACLFKGWKTLQTPVLSDDVQCSEIQLCYSDSANSPAQFAVCYNTKTLIPEFSGHVVKSNVDGSGSDYKWRKDEGTKALEPPNQAEPGDYEPFQQIKENPEWDKDKQYFCSKGHLTPNSDFPTSNEREMTYIVTNAAPQWQKFNEGNWAALERAVRKYAKNKGRDVYVFTGTGGQAKDRESGKEIKMNSRVVAPKWYWKAVCDPVAKESIVFVAQNNVGDQTKTKVQGCNGTPQTSDLGVVFCHGLEAAAQIPEYLDFKGKLPPFDATNCKTSEKGTFMDGFLTGSQGLR